MGWAIRLSRSVEEMHAKGRVHGRLSADGIRIALDACDSEGELIELADIPENIGYHSPERERGEGGSQADDTWAVAVTLYLTLSGNLPFVGATDDEVRRKIASVSAPPLAVYDVGDDDLQGIVDRALTRTRAERTTTVAELRRQLESWGPASGLDALPPLRTGDGDDYEEEVTMIQVGGAEELRKLLDAAISPPVPAIPVTASPDVSAPLLVPSPPASPPAPAPPSPSPVLEGLVDEASFSDESSDPFAIPPSRANVSIAPPAFKPPISSLPPPPFKRPADPPASVATPQPPPEEQPQSRAILLILLAIVIVVGLVAGYYLTAPSGQTGGAEGPIQPPPSATMGRAEAPPQTPVVPAASATAPAVLSTAASAPARAPTDVTACVTPLFPGDSLDPSSDFSFVCAEADALKGAAAVRAQLVRAHRNMSDGMKEWALLGWYEPAAFSVLRAHCCPSASPQKLPEVPRGCAPVSEAFAEIAAAAAATSDPADKALRKAVDAYTDDIHCIVRAGIAARFGRVGNPQGGEDTMFLRFLARVVAAKRVRGG